MPIAPGKTLLKFAGIFYIVTGGFSVVIGMTLLIPAVEFIPDDILRLTLGDFFAVSDFIAIGVLFEIGSALDVPVNFLFVFTVVISMAVLLMGLVTVKHCDYLKKAKLLIILAAVNLAVMAVNMILVLSAGAAAGLVVAALYLAGAYSNDRECKKRLHNLIDGEGR